MASHMQAIESIMHCKCHRTFSPSFVGLLPSALLQSIPMGTVPARSPSYMVVVVWFWSETLGWSIDLLVFVCSWLLWGLQLIDCLIDWLIVRGWGPLLITFDLMNACMQGSTHSHVLLGARSYHVITIVHSSRLLCCLQPHPFQPRSSSRHTRMSL